MTENPTKRKFNFPHPLVLIFFMIVLAQVLSYILPSGEYQTVKDSRNIDPKTFSYVEADHLPWHASLSSIPKGLEKGADIIFFVFIIGGVIGVLRSTGAIDAFIGTLINSFKNQSTILICGMMTLFAIGSSTIGMAEEYMPFIPILITLCLALKLDAMVAMGVVYIGAGIGYGCAALNPFTVLIGQKIAGVQLTSGQIFRWSLLFICLIVAAHHLLRYMKRIRTDSKLSLTHDIDYSKGFDLPEGTPLTSPRIMILVLFFVGISLFTWGALYKGWYIHELATIFLITTLISSILATLSPNKVASSFCNGAMEMTTTALLIGFAQTIGVILTEAKVIHTVVHGLASVLNNFGREGSAIGMLGVQSVFNFFIPSGSGQAYVTMPIMAPLADVTGVSRQISVLAYQIGDGFTNMIVPTNALLMGMLSLARIPFQRWLKFIFPLMIKLYLVAIAAILVAIYIGW